MLKISQKDYNNFHNLFHIKHTPDTHEKDLFSKVYTYLSYTKWIPGLQMVGVCNSLSMFCTNKDSDIDLFVITKKNRLWTVRILLTLFFFLVGQRNTGKNHAGKFCLSFFTGETALNLENIAIEDDIYLFHWMLYIKPIINYNHTYESFIESNSKWCNLKDFKEIIEANKKYIQTQKNTGNTGSFFGDIFEKIIKKMFIGRTLNHYEKIGKPFGVIIDEHMLKFHNDDRRKEIQERIRKSES